MALDDEKKEFRNTWLIAILAVFLTGGYLLIPDAKPTIMWVFLAMSILSITFIANFRKIAESATFKFNRKLHEKIFGFDKNIILGLLIGVVAGFGFIWLTSLKAFAIISLAIPELPYSLTAGAFVIKILAPVVETLFFTILLSSLGLFMSFGIALFIRALMFTSYHYVVYALLQNASVSNVSGAFIGAFLYSIMGGLLAYSFGAEADLSAHGTINSVTYSRVYGALSVVG